MHFEIALLLVAIPLSPKRLTGLARILNMLLVGIGVWMIS